MADSSRLSRGVHQKDQEDSTNQAKPSPFSPCQLSDHQFDQTVQYQCSKDHLCYRAHVSPAIRDASNGFWGRRCYPKGGIHPRSRFSCFNENKGTCMIISFVSLASECFLSLTLSICLTNGSVRSKSASVTH